MIYFPLLLFCRQEKCLQISFGTIKNQYHLDGNKKQMRLSMIIISAQWTTTFSLSSKKTLKTLFKQFSLSVKY